MKKIFLLIAVILIIFLVAPCAKLEQNMADCSMAVCKTAEEVSKTGVIRKVVLVILENTDATQSESLEFMGWMRKNGGYLANYRAITHPSLPNYLALFAGSTFGVQDDNEVNLTSRHLGDLLDQKKIDWKVYAEDYPGHCFLGMEKGLYARRHVPPLNFTTVQQNPQKCSRIVDASQWKVDLSSKSLPNFSIYIPNNENNGHDTLPATADQWMKSRFQALLNDPAEMANLLFIVTYDESQTSSQGNRVFTVFFGAGISPGSESRHQFDHYSLLRTIEVLFGTDSLHEADSRAEPISGVWK